MAGSRQATPPDLIVVTGSTELREPIRDEVSLGREPGNTVVLDDGYLSRRHCKVVRRGERVAVVDLQSYNGTYVNGQKIHEECFLGPGDVVKIGRVTLYVDFKEGGNDSQGLRVHAPDQQTPEAIQPVFKTSEPAVPPVYREVTTAAAQVARTTRGPSQDDAISDAARTKHARRELQEKKTPVPPPRLAESALARSGDPAKATLRDKAVSRDREGMRLIAQLSRILPSVDDQTEFLDLVLTRLLEVVPAERGIIMRLDVNKKNLYIASCKNALPGRTDQEARKLGVSHTLAKKVIRERVSVLVDDAKLDARFKGADSVQDLEIRSLLSAPIWLGEDQVSGLVYLDHLMHAYMFTESDRELLHAVANLIALALSRPAR